MKKENFLGLSERVVELGKQAEQYLTPYFARIDEIADYNTQKVLAAFRAHRVSDTMFAGTTGYGYDDHGRDTLEEIYADLFGTEAGLVPPFPSQALMQVPMHPDSPGSDTEPPQGLLIGQQVAHSL